MTTLVDDRRDPARPHLDVVREAADDFALGQRLRAAHLRARPRCSPPPDPSDSSCATSPFSSGSTPTAPSPNATSAWPAIWTRPLWCITDRRSRLVSLTPRGEQAVAELRLLARDVFADLTAGMATERTGLLVELLRELCDQRIEPR